MRTSSQQPRDIYRAGDRAVGLKGPNVYQGRLKFEIKVKSHCLPKSKFVNWGASMSIERARPLWPPLAPTLDIYVKCDWLQSRIEPAEQGTSTVLTSSNHLCNQIKGLSFVSCLGVL